MTYRILNIGNLVLNNYLLETEKGWIAVDTGYAGSYSRFLAGLRKHGLKLHDIRYLFLTHAHDDHAGFLKEFMQDTDTRLIMSELTIQRL